MVRKFLVIVSFILVTSSALFAETYQPSGFSLNLTPEGLVPVGQNSSLYNFGFGVGLAGEYRFKKKPLFFVSGNLGYSQPPIDADTSLMLASFGVGGGVSYEFARRFNVRGFAHGGGYYARLAQESEFGTSTAFNPYITVGAGFYYFITQGISLGLQTTYNSYSGLYDALGIAIGTAFHFGGFKKKDRGDQLRLTPLSGDHVEVIDVEFEDVFPVFFKYYDNQPIGTAVIRNREDDQITDIRVNLLVKQYMDSPKECAAPQILETGEEQAIELAALFNESVLGITEGTKVAADITIDYKFKDQQYRYTKVETLSLFDRNATRWDDDRKAAAFVTAKDPVVLKFAKNTAGIVNESGMRAVNENLRMATAMHEALTLYGISYVIDPSTPYAEFSQNTTAVDYLQFPKQTLDYKAGDCDDLSILYCALLESVGIETAFITTPGHIHMAFSVNLSPEAARSTFLDDDDLIFMEDKSWLPVEITTIGSGFLKAWEDGAKLWREASSRGKAGFFPVREAWLVYNPVGIRGEGESIDYPNEAKVQQIYQQEMSRYIDREIYPQVVKLQNEIERSGGSPKLVNRLGVLYARYGLIDKAEREFNRVLATQSDYIPTLLNLGNVYYLNEEYDKAMNYYERASAQEPDNPKALLCVARVNHEMENYGTVRKQYRRLKELDPDLASQFAYLDLKGDDAVRAAEAAKIKEAVVWAD
jgi:transglutaminase-like putative cysteine protease